MPGPLSDQARKRQFVEMLTQTGSVTKAVKAVGSSRQRVYQLREEDPQFALRWDNAIEAYLVHQREAMLAHQQALKVQAAQDAMARQSQLKVTEEMVWQELAAVAFTHLRQVMEWGPDGVRLVPSQDLPPYVSAAVQSVKVKSRVYKDPVTKQAVTETDIEVSLHNKLNALKALQHEFALYRHNSEFLDAFVALVLEHVHEEQSRAAIARFLAENAGVPALDQIPAVRRDPGGASEPH